MSSHRQRVMRKFAKLKKKYLEDHPLCEICLLRGVKSPAIDVHHAKGKISEELYLDESNFVAVCRLCHLILHGEAGTIEERERTKKLLDVVMKRKGGSDGT